MSKKRDTERKGVIAGKSKKQEIPREAIAANKEAEQARAVAAALRAGCCWAHPAEARFVVVAITEQPGPLLERSLNRASARKRKSIANVEAINVPDVIIHDADGNECHVKVSGSVDENMPRPRSKFGGGDEKRNAQRPCDETKREAKTKSRSNVAELVSLSGLRIYLKRIHQLPILEPQEECTLVKAWHDHVEAVAKQLNVSAKDIIELADLEMNVDEDGIKHVKHIARRLDVTMSEVIDLSCQSRCLLQGDVALEKLVASHLRLVTGIANSHFGRGLERDDLIAEGTIGLIKAAERFNPSQKARLSTYATWWITGAIRDYVVRMSSLVKIGTTDAQKTLFFSLLKAKARLDILHNDDLEPDQVELLAKDLGVKKQEIIEMNRRLAGDVSLKVPAYGEYGEEIGERIDQLIDGDCQPQKNGGAWWFSCDNQESALIKQDLLEKRSKAFSQAVLNLEDPKQRVIEARHSAYKVITLEDLAGELNLATERVRQIGEDAKTEIQKEIDATAANLKAERTSKKKAEHRPLPHCISKHLTPEVLEAVEQLRKAHTASGPCRTYPPEQRAVVEQQLRSQGRLPNATEIERLAFKAYKARRQEAVKQIEPPTWVEIERHKDWKATTQTKSKEKKA